MTTAQVDATFHGKAYGSVAQKLQAGGMQVGMLRPWIGTDGNTYVTVNQGGQPKAVPIVNDATLRKDEWKQYDEAIIRVARERLTGIADLESRGLVYNITNGLAKTVLEYEDMDDPGEASVSMDGVAKAKAFRPQFGIKYLPLPIIHADYFLNARVLASSRTTGEALDTTMAEVAVRRINEKLEDMLFGGATNEFAFGGGTIETYITFDHRETGSMTAHWNDSAATGATILGDVLGMIQKSIDNSYYGPWVLYIPTEFQTAIEEDYVVGYPKTIRQRLLEVNGLQDIKVADRLATDNIVLVQMTSDVVRLVTGMAITPVEWESEGGMRHHFKVMTIKVPQLRADHNNKTGIVHYT